jgi:hypothetical protein
VLKIINTIPDEYQIIRSADKFFDAFVFNSKVLRYPEFQEFINTIEGSEVLKGNIIHTREDCYIASQNLATGIKAVANWMFISQYIYNPDDVTINDVIQKSIPNLAPCGHNVFRELLSSNCYDRFHNIPFYLESRKVDYDLDEYFVEFNGKEMNINKMLNIMFNS